MTGDNNKSEHKKMPATKAGKRIFSGAGYALLRL
jgi:hypothetical protein